MDIKGLSGIWADYLGFGSIKIKIWEIRDINCDIVGLGISSKGDNKIRFSIPLTFSLSFRFSIHLFSLKKF